MPLHGMLLHEAGEEKEFARWGCAAFFDMLTYLPEPKGDIQITKDALYGKFLTFSGAKEEAFEKCKLGNEINHAIAQGRLPFMEDARSGSERFYRGMDKHTLHIAMDTYEQRQKAHASAS